ncbi:acetyl esterase/lipase [Compostimonas suwonensis]|uniref:Acetyl esterase/lipase n=2 Tax=Compostimonas suwonensis TaxID=1048394 RepID=A0A2M9BU30_9MICO|nr:acetyl esterase/lipase [Compostimonas suwonensis]
MSQLEPGERRRFNIDPIENVDYHLDLDYVGDGIRGHRLDVLVPRPPAPALHSSAPASLPVYVYFHGGGWTSGDKQPLTKYCASQAQAGMVVVNVNYRMATRFQMGHMLQDATAALLWVRENIAGYGGDPERIVLGGDSAGGQIAALVAAAAFHPELAEHYDLEPVLAPEAIRGLVQHCSAVDFSVVFEKGFIMSLDFVRILLPGRGRGMSLPHAARFLSPIEWLGPDFPPVLVTTSERDFFYGANLNFVAELRRHGVQVDTLIYDRARRNTEHTWQQNYRYPESQEVYGRLQEFVRQVAPAPHPVV